MSGTLKSLLIGTILSCIAFVGCGGNGKSNPVTQPPSTVTLTAVAISPSTPSVVAGNSQQLTATGSYSDSSSKDLTASVAWKSSDETVAKVSGSGLVTTFKQGAVRIMAASGSVTATINLSVTAPQIVSLSIEPSTASVAVGLTTQLAARAVLTDTTTSDVTGTVIWSSSDTTIATVGADGSVKGEKQGSVTITANSGSSSASATVTVTAPVLTSIAVVPGTATIATGQTQQFSANGIYSDGSARDVTRLVTWDSTSKASATVDVYGLAAGVGTGTANVTATMDSVTGSASLRVTAAVLTSIDITPDMPSIPAGGQVQFTATGTFSDGSTQDLLAAQWTSSNDAVATVNTSGLAIGHASSGTPVTITASVGTISGSTTLTVTTATLVSITVTPESVSLAKGTNQQFTAIGTFTDGSTEDLTAGVTWAASDPAVVSINGSGFAEALSTGTATVTATSDSIVGASNVTVTPAVVTGISIAPGTSTLGIGGTQQFEATATFNDGSTQDVSSLAIWTSSAASVATIDSAGLASAMGAGTANITATYQNVSSSATLIVTSARLLSIAIDPADPAMAIRSKLQLRAYGNFNDGNSRLLNSVSWRTGSARTANVSGTGVVRSKHAGTARMTATSAGVTGSTIVTVSSSPITSLTIAPQTASIAAGTTANFAAIGAFEDGTQTDLTASVRWTTSDYRVALVNQNGLASGVVAGTVTVNASYGDLTATATLTITGARLTSITISPASSTMPVGAVVQFKAVGNFDDGTSQDISSIAKWTSSDINVAVINSTGLAITAAPGTTTISASLMGVIGTAELIVN